jgi:hypothetical protein
MLALAAVPPAFATGVHFDNDQCGANYETTFDVAISHAGIAFSRSQGSPAKVFMHDGQLTVDSRDVAVSAADAQRLRDYEHQVRALVPEIAAMAREGIDIGFGAMTTVIATFSENAENRQRMLAKLNRDHEQALRQLDGSIGAGRWRQHEVDDLVETTVGDSVGELVGAVTGSAVSAALSGDQTRIAALEARAHSLDHAIDNEVNKRADRLGARAQTLCPRLASLHDIQQQLTFRLPDGSPLVLMTATPSKKKDVASR